MDNAVKTRICWSCEGGLAPESAHCPYCGADQEILAPKVGKDDSSYKLVSATSNQSPIPIPIYKPQKAPPVPKPEDQLLAQVEAVRQKKEELKPQEPVIENEKVKATATKEEPVNAPEGMQSLLFSLMGLIGGSSFFLFGLMLLLFGQNDLLTVHWNASQWPFFLFGSIPCLFAGWHFLTRL